MISYPRNNNYIACLIQKCVLRVEMSLMRGRPLGRGVKVDIPLTEPTTLAA